jgi:hypothetical protein
MALRGKKIESFNDICLTSTAAWSRAVAHLCFIQKSSIGWPQQPLTENVLKFNLYFMILPSKIIFSKYQNTAEFKNLDDSEASTTSMA